MPRIRPGPRKDRSKAKVGEATGVWSGRLRLWIDISGRNALGPGKVRLLEAIAATKSLSAAARRLGISYRLAWKHLRFIEERTGLTVVEPRRGGRDGGGTDLTAQGRALLGAYTDFRRDVEEFTQSACRRHFAKWLSPKSGSSGS